MSGKRELHGKAAIVTGANRGIGLAIIQGLHKAGANVALTGREIKALNEVIDELDDGFKRAIAVQLDVTNQAEIELAVKNIFDQFGHIDILVNNAGIDIISRFIDLDTKAWDDIFAVNVRGTFLVTRSVVPLMIENNVI
jgi:NADP-dependent 3-hydroxy acid dehydrogenase YdfG